MSQDGSLGSLLQGVSQQPAAVRPEGKVTDQVNFTSDVVDGLTSRPALIELANLPSAVPVGLQFIHADFDGQTYIVGFKAGVIKMWSLVGVEQTLTPQDASALAYIGLNMRPYVYDNTLFLANRDTVVAAASSPLGVEVSKTAVAYCLGGLFSRTYTVSIRFSDTGLSAVGTYTTPDGTTVGDAAKTTGTFIMAQISTALAAHANWRAATFTRTLSTSYMHVVSTGSEFTVTATDSESDETLRVIKDTAKSVDKLPAFSVEGHLVLIKNNDDGTADDYWMRFNSYAVTVVGTGFGTEGVWEEWFNTAEVSTFNLATMPHVITKTGPTSFALSRGAWEGRRVGDNNTNEFPDFIGRAIRDIGGFQSRLVVVAGPFCLMSRTNKPLDFFKQSALTTLDTDPIGITSTSEGTIRLDWIIPFDRDLVLMSDPGSGQYIVTGDNRITPGTASLVKTTAFEMRGGAKPVETGRTIMFPYKSGVYSGIKEFFTNDAVATNGADTITETVDKYLVGLVDHMQCSTNFNMAVFKTDSAAHTNTVWVYKYLWQNTDKLQSAWSTWVFPSTARYFFFKGSELIVVMYTATGRYVFAALDLDIPVDSLAGYHICLDRQLLRAASVSSTVVLPYAAAAFVQGTGCATPGRQVHPSATTGPDVSGDYTYTFLAATVPSAAQVRCGLKYSRWVSPTMPFIRDRTGTPAPRTRLVVTSFMVEYADTGYLKAIMSSRYRVAPVEFVMDWFPLNGDPGDPLGNGLRNGILNVPWGERSDWSDFKLFSDDVRPTTILEIEWVGEAFKGSRE